MQGQIIDGQVVTAPPSTALAPIEPSRGLIRPVEDADAIVDAWQQFEKLKARIWVESDYQQIEGKRFPKKSAWRKVAAAFGIDCTVISESRREVENGVFIWEVTCRAAAPNGRCMDGTGACASNERRFSKLHHDVRAVAETRAKNRAIADLVGGGEVSAEEVTVDPDSPEEQFWAEARKLGLNRHNPKHLDRLLEVLRAATAAAKHPPAAEPASPAE